MSVGGSEPDLLCNRGKYYTCICKPGNGEFAGANSRLPSLVSTHQTTDAELYPVCSSLLGRGGGGRMGILSVRFRPARPGSSAFCLHSRHWARLHWQLRVFLAERINAFCRPRPADCPGAMCTPFSSHLLVPM